MPVSERGNIAPVLRYIENAEGPLNILDVGCGSGRYGAAIKNDKEINCSFLAAIEIWEQYITYEMRNIYDVIHIGDARECLQKFSVFRWNFILLLDILEHMTIGEAQKLFIQAARLSPCVIFSVPTKPYPQGVIRGNPHEVHVTQYDEALVYETFHDVTLLRRGKHTGVFVKE